MSSGFTVELHVDDFEKIKKYYVLLGFELVWERKPEGAKGYMVMKLGDNTICFWGGNDCIYDQTYFKRFPKDTPRGYGVELVLTVDDIHSYYEKVKNAAIVIEPLIKQPWGLEDFRVADPFGYYLRFTSKHNILDSSWAVE